MLKAVAGVMFAAILTPLGLRLLLPMISLPQAAQPFEGLLVWWTDLLAIPFEAFDAGSLVGGLMPGGGALGRLDPTILAALIGWTIVQGIVMAVLGVLGRRSTTGYRDEP